MPSFTPCISLLQLVWGKLQKSWQLGFKCRKLRLIWIFCCITTTWHNQVVAIAHSSALEELTPSFRCCCNNHIVSLHNFFFWQRLHHLYACRTSEFELINQILKLLPHCFISNVTCIKCLQQCISSNANNDPSSPSLVTFHLHQIFRWDSQFCHNHAFFNRSIGSSSNNRLFLIAQVQNNFVRFFLNFCIFLGTFSKLILYHILNVQSCDNSFHHLKIWCNLLVFFPTTCICKYMLPIFKIGSSRLFRNSYFFVITSNIQFKVFCMFRKPCSYQFIHFWTSLATQNCQKKSLHTPYNQNLHHGAKILIACVVQQVATWSRSCCVYTNSDHLRCKLINLVLYFWDYIHLILCSFVII